jgi:hypothetical protein
MVTTQHTSRSSQNGGLMALKVCTYITVLFPGVSSGSSPTWFSVMASTFTNAAIPPFPRLQATDSATFRKPPLDGSYTLAQMYDWHGVHSPEHQLLLYPRSDQSVRVIDRNEGAQAVRRGAKIIRERVQASPETTKGKVPLVAILSAAGMFTHLKCS